MATAGMELGESPAWPRPAGVWWMVALLFLAGIFSVIDRTILNMVVDPVRHDLAIGDNAISLLQGLAFGVFYAFMGVPMGLAADRVSRRNLLLGGIAVWSLATISSGFAANFGQFFSARLLVGLGEAALGPCAISLIADLFPPERRGRPISVYMMGQSLAAGIGIAFTGHVLGAAAHGVFAGWPVLTRLAPWRIVFVLAGTLGLTIIAALLTTREPARRKSAIQDERSSADRASLSECLRWFVDRRAMLAPLYFGFAICFIAAYGSAAWQPTLLMRGFGASPQFVGAWLGPLSMLFAMIGPLVGGWLLDRAMQRGRPTARFALLMIAPLLALPSTMAILAGNVRVAAFVIASGNAVYGAAGTLMFATLQSIVPPRMRGTAIALTLVLNTLLGATCGPLLIATVTGLLPHRPAAVGWAIALIAGPALILAAGLFGLARRAVVQSDSAAGSQD